MKNYLRGPSIADVIMLSTAKHITNVASAYTSHSRFNLIIQWFLTFRDTKNLIVLVHFAGRCTLACLDIYIARKHKDAPEVKSVLKLSGKERAAAFELFRKDRIYKHNIQESESTNPKYFQERKPKINTGHLMCSTCKGFFMKRKVFFVTDRSV